MDAAEGGWDARTVIHIYIHTYIFETDADSVYPLSSRGRRSSSISVMR